MRHVAVGFDVTYGKGRSGDPEAMQRCGKEFGFSVSVTGEVDSKEGWKISSTAIRALLREGRPEQAAALLGRPFAIEGLVEKGRQLGRKLGFPTANVTLGEYVAPRFGVYATRTRLRDGRELGGVTNVGVNPTFGGSKRVIETYMIDYSQQSEIKKAEISFVERLRNEVRFKDSRELIDQMKKDVEVARSILKNNDK